MYVKLELCTIRFFAAVKFHMSPGGKPPMSHWVYALNSFVLPAHEVDVSRAPLLGQNALMEKFNLTIRLILSKMGLNKRDTFAVVVVGMWSKLQLCPSECGACG